MSSTMNQVYTAFSFIGFVLSVIPFYWHFQAWNTGTCMYMIWNALGCLIYFINSILWRGNMLDKAPIYCDIVTRLEVGMIIGIPACTLCIYRSLYNILVVKTGAITWPERRRTIIIDLLITVGLPVLAMGLEYIVTPYSYGIFEDIGCLTVIRATVPTILLFAAWPIVIGFVSFVYCSMILYHFIKHNRQLAVMLSHQDRHRTRYIRLMLLASTEMLTTVPISSFMMRYVCEFGLTKFSWSTLRHNYTHVPQYPTFEWQSDPVRYAATEIDVWLPVYSAFIFFAFFGLTDEARNHYRRVYLSITRRIRFSESSSTLAGSSHAMSSSKTANVIVSVVKSRNRRDSFLSFSDQSSIPSVSIAGDLQCDFVIGRDSSLESTVPSDGPQGQLPQPPDEVNPTAQLVVTSTHTTGGADAV